MPIGRKKTLILLQLTDTADGMGGFTRTWAEKRKVEGVFTSLSDKERFYINDKKTVLSNYKFHVDYPIGITITEKDQFKLDTRLFEIVGIDNPGDQNIILTFSLLEIV